MELFLTVSNSSETYCFLIFPGMFPSMTMFVATPIEIFYSRGRTWEMARSVIDLFCKLEGLSPIPEISSTAQHQVRNVENPSFSYEKKVPEPSGKKASVSSGTFDLFLNDSNLSVWKVSTRLSAPT